MDHATVKAAFIYGPDYAGYAGDGLIFQTGIAVPLPIEVVALTIDSNFGYNHTSQFFFGTHNNYLDWNVGLIVGLHKNLSFDLRYVDTDIGSSAGSIADQRFVGGATFSF